MTDVSHARAMSPGRLTETGREDGQPLDVARTGVFEGYASVFDKADLGRDIVSRGAFRASLVRRGPAAIRMLFQHDPATPIGVWERIYEDARGLFVRGRLTLASPRAREVYALMKDGAIDGLSIGFRTVKGMRDGRTGLRRLTEIDLWEISVVTFPMLLDARVGSIKSTGESATGNPPRSDDVVTRIDQAIALLGHKRSSRRSQSFHTSTSTRTRPYA